MLIILDLVLIQIKSKKTENPKAIDQNDQMMDGIINMDKVIFYSKMISDKTKKQTNPKHI